MLAAYSRIRGGHIYLEHNKTKQLTQCSEFQLSYLLYSSLLAPLKPSDLTQRCSPMKKVKETADALETNTTPNGYVEEDEPHYYPQDKYGHLASCIIH